MPDKKTKQTRCLGGFLISGYQNFCSLPKWLGYLAQKRPFLPQNMLYCHWAHLSLAGLLIWCPSGWLVGGCGRRATLLIERLPPLWLWGCCETLTMPICATGRRWGRERMTRWLTTGEEESWGTENNGTAVNRYTCALPSYGSNEL